MIEFKPIPLTDYLEHSRRSKEFGSSQFFILDAKLEKLAQWVYSKYGDFQRLAQVNHAGTDAQFVEFSIIPTNPARLILTLGEVHGIEIESEIWGGQFRVIQNENWEYDWDTTIQFLNFKQIMKWLTGEFDKVMEKYEFLFDA